jgi:hypothetical protein
MTKALPADVPIIVESIYEPMAEAGKPAFREPDLSALHAVVRLTVEFHQYLATASLEIPDKDDTRWVCDSTIAGIKSFVHVNQLYSVLVGSMDSNLKWDFMSLESFKQRFNSIYQEFMAEQIFEKKCRVLLDLFKLQIAFTGMCYE